MEEFVKMIYNMNYSISACLKLAFIIIKKDIFCPYENRRSLDFVPMKFFVLLKYKH